MKKDLAIRIGMYKYTIQFVNTIELNNCDGITIHNLRLIKVRNDLDKVGTMIVLMHEITHALLGTQGRVYQESFNVEEVCEFIGYNLPMLSELANTIEDLVFNEDNGQKIPSC